MTPREQVMDALPSAETAHTWLSRECGDELVAAIALCEVAWCQIANNSGAKSAADYLAEVITRLHQADAGQSTGVN